MPIDYIASFPCPKCGAYRHKSEFSVGRRECKPCQDSRWSGLYQPDMDTQIKQWEEEAEHARVTSDGIILFGD